MLPASITVVIVLGWLLIKDHRPSPVVPPLGAPQQVKIRIEVSSATLPVSIGVPISEQASIADEASLTVVDSSGEPVPTCTRVLARWKGTPGDTNRAIKWILVDFAPRKNGLHFLTNGGRMQFEGVGLDKSDNSIIVSSSRLQIELPLSGDKMITRFRLDNNDVLRAPAGISAKLPARAVIAARPGAADTLTVTDAMLFKPGETVGFEHRDSLKWEAAAGSSRIATQGHSFLPQRICRLDEGTPRQEDVEIRDAQATDHQTISLLKFSHPAGSPIRDLPAEAETAVVRKASGQTLEFSAPLKLKHADGGKIFVSGGKEFSVHAVINQTTVEESNRLRVVIRQAGSFRNDSNPLQNNLQFAIRYYIYAGQPFVRTRLRLMNNGVYGFGSGRTGQQPFAQHIILKELSMLIPADVPTSTGSSVKNGAEARSAIALKRQDAILKFAPVEIGVPEFAENFPKALKSDGSGIHFDILPETGEDHIFDGARAKTVDFYLGRNVADGLTMTNRLNARLDPGYIASTGSVRPAFIEKRDWDKPFSQDRQMAEAAPRFEKMLAAAYAVEQSEAAGAVPATSIFEYRQRGENGEQFGWRNFGDLAWGDGYANVHYDLPFVLLREYLRTGDARAFQLGSEMARYRADWGHYRADDYFDLDRKWNLKGMAFYEKGDHGTYREPVPSHTWIEGMWLYWALTGDEAVRESAMDGSNAFARMNFNYYNSLGWNEPRWLGWPTFGLVIAYRYTGEERFLNKARENIQLFEQTEESFGRKGYYISRGADVIQAAQPWAWCYSLLGVVEYWRDTGDPRAAGLIVRAADWVIGKDNPNPPIKQGELNADGTYSPIGISYFWSQEKTAADRSVALCGLCLPVITTAARITGRDDLWLKAREIFRDYAFYRDLPESRNVNPSDRAVINFRSLQFPASVTKVYGQMGLTVSDFLPDIFIAGEKALKLQTPALAGSTDAPGMKADNTGNLALNRRATASSFKTWPKLTGTPGTANDGLTYSAGKYSAWHSEINSGQTEWWQVDLGRSCRIDSIEILFREDVDQPSTRQNIEALGSNDPNFKNSTLLAALGENPIPFKQPWRASIGTDTGYRFIRIRKTKIDKDASGQSFFALAEVKVFGK